MLNEVFAGKFGFTEGIRDLLNAHNRDEDQMRDTCLLGRLQQAARAFEIDLPVAFAGEMDHHIHALDGPRETLSGYQISLLPLRARPILTRAGPPAHPTHGIPCRAQLLHDQAAQFSRAAGY